MRETHVRLTWPWRLIAPAIALIALSYPFLVTYVELRPLQHGDMLAPVLVVMIAVGYWWYAAHAAVLTEHGATFRGPFRTRTLRWREVAGYEVTSSWVIAVDSSGRRYRVSSCAENASTLADELRSAGAKRDRG